MAAKELEVLHSVIEALPEEQKKAAKKAVKKVKNQMPPWAWFMILSAGGGVWAWIQTNVCPIACPQKPAAVSTPAEPD